MAIKYLKKAIKTPSTEDHKTRTVVQNILNDIEKRKEDSIKEITKKFDKYEGEIVVSKDKIEEAIKKVDQKTKDDVQFAYERIKKFAEYQLKSMNNNFEVELSKGLFAAEGGTSGQVQEVAEGGGTRGEVASSKNTPHMNYMYRYGSGVLKTYFGFLPEISTIPLID